MTTHVQSSPPRWPRVAAVPGAVAVVLVGIWMTGGVLTNDFRASMALTALWFAAVAAAALLVWRRLPGYRAAAVAGLAAFVVVGAVLAAGTLRDKTVNEIVATGPPALSGGFESRAHTTRGRAAVVETAAGPVLTLTGFRTDPGPDLFVYVVPGRTAGESVDGGARLGRLKGNVGNQQYSLAETPDGPATVVIWCRAFSVAFGAAVVTPA